MKAAIKREQCQACLSIAEREQARFEESIVNSEKGRMKNEEEDCDFGFEVGGDDCDVNRHGIGHH